MTNSVYELLNPLTQERKTRFWDWFDGDALNAMWTEAPVGGGGTVSMDDAVDGGVKIVTNAGNNDGIAITHNQIRHFSDTPTMIAIWKTTSTSSLNQSVGISKKIGSEISVKSCETALVVNVAHEEAPSPYSQTIVEEAACTPSVPST